MAKDDVKIRFDSFRGTTKGFTDSGVYYTKDSNGGAVEHRVHDEFRIEIPEGKEFVEMTIPKETYDYLRSKKAIRSKAEQKVRTDLQAKMFTMHSGRAETDPKR